MNPTEGHHDPASHQPHLWYKFISDNAMTMLSCHDLSGTYLYVTPSCRQLLGYAPEELIGRLAYELFHPEDLAITQGSHERIRREPGSTSRIIYRIRHNDGRYLSFETTSAVFSGLPGRDAPVIYASSQPVADGLHPAPEPAMDKAREAQLVTVCAWSKKILFEGEWLRLEEFLWRRFELRVSHGIAPDVFERLKNFDPPAV